MREIITDEDYKEAFADYTTGQLYREIKRRQWDGEHVGIVMWVNEDVRECMRNMDIEPTDELVDLCWDEMHGGEWLDDRCTELGWEVLDAFVYSAMRDEDLV